MAGKDVAWLAGTLNRLGYRVADPAQHVHDGKKRFLLVTDPIDEGQARWCAKDQSLAPYIREGETAYECPDEYWWEFNFTMSKLRR